jgi:hypothetical protein
VKAQNSIFYFLEQYRNGQFFGDERLFFQTLESFVSLRDEAAAFFILDKRAEEIIPANNRWLHNLQKMMAVFFVEEKRTPIRAKVIFAFIVIHTHIHILLLSFFLSFSLSLMLHTCALY